MSPHKIGIVISSSRPTRIGHRVAEGIRSLAPAQVDAGIIDLAEIDLPFLAEPEQPAAGNYTLQSTTAWSSTVRSYDALIITVPEYNAGYPAVLKNAIDTLYAEWKDLPIGVLGYGWEAADSAVRQFEEVLDRVQAMRFPGPGLKFGRDLTPEGETLENTPVQEILNLYAQILIAVGEKRAA